MNQILDDQIENSKEKTKFESTRLSFQLTSIAFIFGMGFLIFIINGYYHFNFIKFQINGRTDLIARLGFLAHITGFLFYPSSIIIYLFINSYFSKKWRENKISTILFSILGLLGPAILFYGEVFTKIFMGPKEKWILGLILIVISIFLMQKLK